MARLDHLAPTMEPKGGPRPRSVLATIVALCMLTVLGLGAGPTLAQADVEISQHEDATITLRHTSLGAVAVETPAGFDCDTPITPENEDIAGVSYTVDCEAPNPATCKDPTVSVDASAHPRWEQTNSAFVAKTTCLPDEAQAFCGWFYHPHGILHIHADGTSCTEETSQEAPDTTTLRCSLRSWSLAAATMVGGTTTCSARLLPSTA